MRSLAEEYRTEARRLLSLSESEIEIEHVALALRIGAESEDAAAQLQSLDAEFLEFATGGELDE